MFVLTILSGVYSQIRTKYTKEIALFALSLLTIIVAFSSPDHNADFYSYQRYYHQTLSGVFHFEYGFSLLILLFGKLGFDYLFFRFIVALLSGILLFMGLKRFTNNPSLVIVVYAITTFVVDTIQLRNYFALSILVLAMSFFIEQNKKQHYLGVALIIVAAQIQSIGYIFLLAPVVLYVIGRFEMATAKSVLSKLPLGMLFITVLIQLTGFHWIVTLLTKAVSFMPTRGSVLISKISSEFAVGSSWKLLLAISVSFVAVFYMVLKEFWHDEIITRKAAVLVATLSVGLLTLPLITLAPDYTRIQRNVLFFAMIALGGMTDSKDNKVSKITLNLAFVSLLAVILFTGWINVYVWGPDLRREIMYLLMLK